MWTPWGWISVRFFDFGSIFGTFQGGENDDGQPGGGGIVLPPP